MLDGGKNGVSPARVARLEGPFQSHTTRQCTYPFLLEHTDELGNVCQEHENTLRAFGIPHLLETQGKLGSDGHKTSSELLQLGIVVDPAYDSSWYSRSPHCRLRAHEKSPRKVGSTITCGAFYYILDKSFINNPSSLHWCSPQVDTRIRTLHGREVCSNRIFHTTVASRAVSRVLVASLFMKKHARYYAPTWTLVHETFCCVRCIVVYPVQNKRQAEDVRRDHRQKKHHFATRLRYTPEITAGDEQDLLSSTACFQQQWCPVDSLNMRAIFLQLLVLGKTLICELNKYIDRSASVSSIRRPIWGNHSNNSS